MAGDALPKGISLRKDGRYMWRFQYAGESYTGYCKTVAAAKKALRDKRYEIEHGISSKEKTVQFDAWFSEWLDTYKADLKESTLNQYRNTYERYIKPVFGKKQIKNIRGDMIQKFINQMNTKYSKSIVSTANFLLFDSLQQAARGGLITRNPMESTTPPKFKKRKKKRALTLEAERAFLEAAKTSPYYPLYRMASLTGMRIGEVLGLQWSDVDFKRGELHINHTLSYIPKRGLYLDTPKSSAGRRIIPISKHSEAYSLLWEWRKEQASQREEAGIYWRPLDGMEYTVFTSRNGTPHYDTNIRKDQRRIVEQLKEQGIEIDCCTFHTLRHCFATRCIENGMDPKVLQAILGHSTFSTTVDLYVDVMEETKREEMGRIMEAL